MRISFQGAARVVTGSCYLVESGSTKFLVDCGMFQGEEDEGLNSQFKFNPREIDFVLLTHAHIDHSGLLPKLAREGFHGKVYTTYPTIEIIEPLLLDSAKIQEYAKKRLEKPRSRSNKYSSKPIQFLYDTDDVYPILDSCKGVNLGEWNKEGETNFKFIRAGHILGAASILVELEGKRIVFSGDIGRREQSLIESYEYLEEDVDYIVMESLYGGQVHESREVSIKNLIDEINETVKGYGNVIIPVFALHRSQEIVLNIKDALRGKQINKDVQVFLDGPLSVSVTELYTTYLSAENGDYSANSLVERDPSGIFFFDNLRIVKDNLQSLKILRGGQRIVLAGGGMCEGGRIMNHLSRGLKKNNVKVIFVGYQAEGTLGRDIISGKKMVYVNGKKVKVRAEIVDLKGFSAHAGNDDLLDWLRDKESDRLKKVFLTHSEIDRSTAFADQLEDKKFEVSIPELYSSVEL